MSSPEALFHIVVFCASITIACVLSFFSAQQARDGNWPLAVLLGGLASLGMCVNCLVPPFIMATWAYRYNLIEAE